MPTLVIYDNHHKKLRLMDEGRRERGVMYMWRVGRREEGRKDGDGGRVRKFYCERVKKLGRNGE